MPTRYLAADSVKLDASIPQFAEPGHCLWCNKLLTGKATKYCRPTEEWKMRYQLNYGRGNPVDSECSLYFQNWWYSRPAFIRATFNRDNFTCQECGYHKMMDDRPWLPDISDLECDHIIPLARGGLTELNNLQTLCRPCNRKKAASMPEDTVQKLPRVIPSRDNSKCPYCGAHGYTILPWEVPDCYDPLMIEVKCSRCGEVSYIGPQLKQQASRRVLSASRR